MCGDSEGRGRVCTVRLHQGLRDIPNVSTYLHQRPRRILSDSSGAVREERLAVGKEEESGEAIQRASDWCAGYSHHDGRNGGLRNVPFICSHFGESPSCVLSNRCCPI